MQRVLYGFNVVVFQIQPGYMGIEKRERDRNIYSKKCTIIFKHLKTMLLFLSDADDGLDSFTVDLTLSDIIDNNNNNTGLVANPKQTSVINMP